MMIQRSGIITCSSSATNLKSVVGQRFCTGDGIFGRGFSTATVCRKQHERLLSGIRRLSSQQQQQQHQQQQQQQQTQWGPWAGLVVRRLGLAYGFSHVMSEYVFQLTKCDGPSMLPTINPRGEILLVDRLSPRLFGMDGGCKGEDRVKQAREKQEKHVRKRKKEKEKRMQKKILLASKHSNHNQIMNDDDDDTWHQPMIPADELPREGFWKRVYHNLTTGISVGDVVVLKHPQRDGQVCKRVLGLPGDEVIQRNKELIVVPDGHMWVEGDNTANSSDSRTYGTVPAAMLVGRALVRVWPIRGDAIIQRGARPKQYQATGSTVLPSGYNGETIVLVSEEDHDDGSESYPPRTL